MARSRHIAGIGKAASADVFAPVLDQIDLTPIVLFSLTKMIVIDSIAEEACEPDDVLEIRRDYGPTRRIQGDMLCNTDGPLQIGEEIPPGTIVTFWATASDTGTGYTFQINWHEQ